MVWWTSASQSLAPTSVVRSLLCRREPWILCSTSREKVWPPSSDVRSSWKNGKQKRKQNVSTGWKKRWTNSRHLWHGLRWMLPNRLSDCACELYWRLFLGAAGPVLMQQNQTKLRLFPFLQIQLWCSSNHCTALAVSGALHPAKWTWQELWKDVPHKQATEGEERWMHLGLDLLIPWACEACVTKRRCCTLDMLLWPTRSCPPTSRIGQVGIWEGWNTGDDNRYPAWNVETGCQERAKLWEIIAGSCVCLSSGQDSANSTWFHKQLDSKWWSWTSLGKVMTHDHPAFFLFDFRRWHTDGGFEVEVKPALTDKWRGSGPFAGLMLLGITVEWLNDSISLMLPHTPQHSILFMQCWIHMRASTHLPQSCLMQAKATC